MVNVNHPIDVGLSFGLEITLDPDIVCVRYGFEYLSRWRDNEHLGQPVR